MTNFKIAGISFDPELWEPGKNLKELLFYIDEAAEKGANVIASPEGILDGYITRDLSKNRISETDSNTEGFESRVAEFRKRQVELAKEIKSKCIPELMKKAKEKSVYLFINTLDIREQNKVFNTTFVFDTDGKLIGKYDKIHAGFEVVNELGKEYNIFETEYAPIGVLICADRQFPETARSVALNGARVLIINSYGMWGEGANERFIRQRAYENGLFVLFCHPNESVILSPEGRIIAATCGWENTVVREIDPSEAFGRGIFGTAEMAETYEIKNKIAAYKTCNDEAVERQNRS